MKSNFGDCIWQDPCKKHDKWLNDFRSVYKIRVKNENSDKLK